MNFTEIVMLLLLRLAITFVHFKSLFMFREQVNNVNDLHNNINFVSVH